MLNVARALERMRSELANRDPEYILSVVLEYVDKHFTENISQEELAARFRYNSAYFSRMFKKHRGENLSDYITKKRIDYAAELLLTTELSAEQISERVGYKSKPQFYNTFTRYMDKTPRQYRIDNK
jgi:two-component system response regulator YesN